jgi:hypothetical protein
MTIAAKFVGYCRDALNVNPINQDFASNFSAITGREMHPSIAIPISFTLL